MISSRCMLNLSLGLLCYIKRWDWKITALLSWSVKDPLGKFTKECGKIQEK